LYELRKLPNDTYKYTNYIYGIDGEIVAQISGTKTDGNTPVSAGIWPLFTDLFNFKDFNDFANKLGALTDALFEKPENVQYAFMLLLILALIGTLGILVYNAFLRERHTVLIPRWLMHAAPVVLFAIFATFGLTGCFELLLPDATVDGIFYFTPNHIGSVSIVTDQYGVVVKRYKYKPYGEKIKEKSYSSSDILYENFDVKYKFTAQEDDDTTGLYYYGARFYDPEVGRFITPDSMVPDPENTQHFNRYMYCSGNPVKYNDPSGHEGEDSWGGDAYDSGENGMGFAGPPAGWNPGGTGSASTESYTNNIEVDINGRTVNLGILSPCGTVGPWGIYHGDVPLGPGKEGENTKDTDTKDTPSSQTDTGPTSQPQAMAKKIEDTPASKPIKDPNAIYKPSDGGRNNDIDNIPENTVIFPMYPGEVIGLGFNPPFTDKNGIFHRGYGWYVKIKNSAGKYKGQITTYGHMNKEPDVIKGDIIRLRDMNKRIGGVGKTGSANNVLHLHIDTGPSEWTPADLRVDMEKVLRELYPNM
jgi:RHS repeat-associated protein